MACKQLTPQEYLALTAEQRKKGFAKESDCLCCTGGECQKCSYDYIDRYGTAEECPADTDVKTNISNPGQPPQYNCRKYAPYDPAQGAECPEIGGGWTNSGVAKSICCNEVCCQAGEICCEGKCREGGSCNCGTASWIWTPMNTWWEAGNNCVNGCVRGAGPTNDGSVVGEQITTDCVPGP